MHVFTVVWLCLVSTVLVEIRAGFDKRNMNMLFIPKGVIELLDGGFSEVFAAEP